MCGIFGASSNKMLSVQEEKYIKQSLYVGTLRGFDSTGITLIDREGNCSTFKRALSGPDFVGTSSGAAAMRELRKAYAAIGHNRAATRGAVNDGTAHPFDFGRLVGCHNGTLSGNRGLKVTEMPVDSMNLLSTLNQEVEDGDDAAYAEIMKEVDGSFALNWYEYETCLMYFTRNSQRELHFYQEKAGSTLFWASEKAMMHWILSRCNIKHKYDDIVEVPTNRIISFDTNTSEFVGELEYTPKPVVSYPAYNRGQYSGVSSSTSSDSKSLPPKKDDPYDRDIRNDSYYGVKTEVVGAQKAVDLKLWSKKDTSVIFVARERHSESPQSADQFLGVAYTQDGERFEATVWGGNTVVGQPYAAQVVFIKFFEDRKGVLCIGLSNQMNKFFLKDKDAKQTITALEADNVITHDPWEQIAERVAKKEDSDNKVVPIDKKTGSSIVTLVDPDTQMEETYVSGPKGGMIPLVKFAELTQDGCFYCADDITPDDACDLGWERIDDEWRPVCSSCLPEVTESLEVK